MEETVVGTQGRPAFAPSRPGGPGRRNSLPDLAVVAIFTMAVFIPFLGKAYHIDEPFFLREARQILSDPLHPFDFDFNWYGRLVPFPQINNTPPLHGYLLALAWKLTGGREGLMRLAFLPADFAAAASLYLLAARFLRAPLLPTLIVIAAPAYAVNLNHLMPEKLAAAFAFSSLYALVRGVDENRPRWFWASAVLCGAGLMAKYSAIFVILPVFGYGLERSIPWKRLCGYAVAACSGLVLYFLYDRLTHRATGDAAWGVLGDAAREPWAVWSHKLRSILAFTGGCGVATAVWPFFVYKPKGRVLPALAAAGLLLFAPFLDIGRRVPSMDRWTGVVMAGGALWGLIGLFRAPGGGRGWPLWAPWVLSVLLVQGSLYWSVLARLVLFLIPPLVFAMAETLENIWTERRLRMFHSASLAATLLVSLALSVVDYRYAWAQKAVARDVADRYIAHGRRVWFTGHWGLQYYMEQAGARALAVNRGGWGAVGRGDVVVVPEMNAGVVHPGRRRLSNVSTLSVEYPVPVRLIASGTDAHQAGFYSNAFGFLPYSFNAGPLERFEFVEMLDDGAVEAAGKVYFLPAVPGVEYSPGAGGRAPQRPSENEAASRSASGVPESLEPVRKSPHPALSPEGGEGKGEGAGTGF